MPPTGPMKLPKAARAGKGYNLAGKGHKLAEKGYRLPVLGGTISFEDVKSSTPSDQTTQKQKRTYTKPHPDYYMLRSRSARGGSPPPPCRVPLLPAVHPPSRPPPGRARPGLSRSAVSGAATSSSAGMRPGAKARPLVRRPPPPEPLPRQGPPRLPPPARELAQPAKWCAPLQPL